MRANHLAELQNAHCPASSEVLKKKYRLFGRNSGLRVSECCLGGSNFGTATPNGLEPSAAREIMAAFADAGGNFIGSGYQAGQSEEIIGKFIKPKRDAFVVGTKYSIGVDRSEHYAVRGNSRKAMMASIDGSLPRLLTDHVDIFWLHGYDGVTPMEEILRGTDDLVSARKVLYVGFSNFASWRLSRGALLAELRGYVALSIERRPRVAVSDAQQPSPTHSGRGDR